MNDMFGLLTRNSVDLTACGIDEKTLITECRYVVLDTELTGLEVKKDSIVSIGAVAMTGGSIHLGETLYRLVSPETELRGESVVVHGITPSDVAGKPTVGPALDALLAFCEGAVVVGHFLSLDLKFLNKELKRLDDRLFPCPVADTFRIHEWIREHDVTFGAHYKGMVQDTDLFTMAKKYHIQVSAAHNALMDAFVTAQLFQRFLSFLPGLGVRTVKDLLRIGKP